jgi:hypothetical protein
MKSNKFWLGIILGLLLSTGIHSLISGKFWFGVIIGIIISQYEKEQTEQKNKESDKDLPLGPI